MFCNISRRAWTAVILITTTWTFVVFFQPNKLTPFDTIDLLTKKENRYFSKQQLQYLNCKDFVKKDNVSVQNYINQGRLKIDQDSEIELGMDCTSIEARIYGDVEKFEPLKRKVAYIRNIYRFYEQQEVFLSMIYHPDNVYCYALDEKSSFSFKTRMRKLSSCFLNIYILDEEYSFDSTGYLQDRAHIDCLRRVMQWKWRHALLIQNDDMTIKSVYQISNLSKTLKNVSLIENEEGFTHRYDTTQNLTAASLQLYKDETSVPNEILHRKIAVRKTSNQVFLSRLFVRSIFEKLNLEGIIKFFDDKKFYGVDEMLFSTLYFNYLGLDTQIESHCSDNLILTSLRFVIWNFGSNPTQDCFINQTRHGVCVFGIEYLPRLVKEQAIIANKVMSYYDFGTLLCMKELVRNDLVQPEADANRLMEWPQFREMIQKTKGTFNPTSLKC